MGVATVKPSPPPLRTVIADRHRGASARALCPRPNPIAHARGACCGWSPPLPWLRGYVGSRRGFDYQAPSPSPITTMCSPMQSRTPSPAASLAEIPQHLVINVWERAKRHCVVFKEEKRHMEEARLTAPPLSLSNCTGASSSSNTRTLMTRCEACWRNEQFTK
jgi:hypothetical protein